MRGYREALLATGMCDAFGSPGAQTSQSPETIQEQISSDSMLESLSVVPDIGAGIAILVGGVEHFLFFHFLGIIIPTDFHMFQRGRSTTNQNSWDGSHNLPGRASSTVGPQPSTCLRQKWVQHDGRTMMNLKWLSITFLKPNKEHGMKKIANFLQGLSSKSSRTIFFVIFMSLEFWICGFPCWIPWVHCAFRILSPTDCPQVIE
jgi:hypothetical protein